MDSLVVIPRSEWPKLIDLYDSKWPNGSPTSCVLDSYLSYQNFSEIFDLNIFCAFGDISHGVVITSDQFGLYEIMIRPLNDISKIEEALLNTKLIDWDREVTIPAATQEVEDCLQRLEDKLNIKIKVLDNVYTHVLGKQSKQYENLEIPPNTYVTSLKPQHIKIIDESWTYHNAKTHLFFQLLAKNGLTYVVYLEEKPAAWVTVATNGALTHWYCLESYRRRGYGEFIMKYAINDRLKKGKHIVAFTVEKNKVAQNLFNKLGFEVFDRNKWLSVRRQ